MNIHYLEIVTTDVDKQTKILSATHGLSFTGPVAELGNAMVADTQGGGRIGVRAPMHDQEQPATRPYMLADDIDSAIKAAEEAGAMVAMMPTEIPGQGKIAIYFIDGTEHGLWQA